MTKFAKRLQDVESVKLKKYTLAILTEHAIKMAV